MRKKIRTTLLFLSALAFLAIAPAVVLYAIGYRPSALDGGAPASVGVLLIDATPRRAEVEVNGKTIGRVPEAVPDLMPGSAQVTVKKEGYVSWQKSLPIYPAQATEARNVWLFPENPLRQTLAPDVGVIALAPNRSLLAYATSFRQLRVMTVLGEEVTRVSLSAVPESILWSPDNAVILVTLPGKRYQLVYVSGQGPAVKNLPALSAVKLIHWDPRIPGRLFAQQETGDVMAYSTSLDTRTRIRGASKTLAVSSRRLYVVDLDNVLHAYSLQGQLLSSTPLEKPVDSIEVTPGDDIAVVFENRELALLTSDHVLKPVAEHVNMVAWSPSGRMLLLQLEHNELSVYNVNDERQYHIPLEELHLVVRLSRTINHPQWYAGGNHLVYQVDDEIVITEIDTRDHPVSFVVDTTNTGNARLEVGEDGDTLFYITRHNDTDSLMSTSLLTEADRN